MIPREELVNELKEKHPQVQINDAGHIIIPAAQLSTVMRELRDIHGYNFLTNVTGADYLEHFEMVYNLSKIGTPEIIHIKTKVDRSNPVVDSMVPLWGGANWQEREVFDLLGITFTGHPDLRRILLDDEWEGHPLRRDYQWEGGRD